VDLIDFQSAQPAIRSLHKVSSWRCASKAAFLSVQQVPRAPDAMDDDDLSPSEREHLHVGDSVKSVYVLDLVDSKLVDVARDYMQNWVVAMEELEANGGSVIISDVSGSYLVQHYLLTSALAFVQRQDSYIRRWQGAECRSNGTARACHQVPARSVRAQHWHELRLLGFYTGSISSAETGNISKGSRPKPEVVFATSSGTIGIIADIGPQDSQMLSELQLNMDGVVKGPLVDWRKWVFVAGSWISADSFVRYRELHSEGTTKAPGTAGFLDGNL
jgi:hypothetical protein